MKPVAFDYFDPRTVEETMDLLREHGEGGKLLAGGQSLIPLMNFRLVRPAALIDLNRVEELTHIRQREEWLEIGAMTRDRDLEESPLVREKCGLLALASSCIGHAQIRNRSTIGGGAAHNDPAGEVPAALIALDAKVLIRNPAGEVREEAAEDFFVTYLTTLLEPTDLLSGFRIPIHPPGSGFALREFARRSGDFAIAGSAALVTLADGVCTHAGVALMGVGPAAIKARQACDCLMGRKPSAHLVGEASRLAREQAEPDDDIHASADFRRDLVEELTRSALTEAFRNAGANVK
ncbi:MAG: FAD binding domain-containing protein [Nitrospinota bacterium]